LNTETADPAEAGKFADKVVKHKNANDLGKMIFEPGAKRVRVNELLDDYVAEYRKGGEKGIRREPDAAMSSHLAVARQYFGNERALGIGKRVQQFINERLEARYAEATINRPLQMLKAAFKIATEGRNGNPPKLPRVPHIQLLDESANVRKGKISPQEAELLFDSLPAYLADFARFEYETASRPKEIRALRWTWVTGDSIEVPGQYTKNREPRSIALTPELNEILARRRLARLPGYDLIFHDGHGNPVGDYRAAWYSACVINGLGEFYCRHCKDADGHLDSALDAKLKCPCCGQKYSRKKPKPKYLGKLFYDFKRSACHEMRKSGSTVEDCMEVSGHLTPNMFKRYADLFTDEEKRAVQRKVQARRHQWREAETANVLMMPKQGGNVVRMPKLATLQ